MVTAVDATTGRIKRFLRDESGAETIEWALICAILVIGTLIAITAIGNWMRVRWNSVEAAPGGL